MLCSICRSGRHSASSCQHRSKEAKPSAPSPVPLALSDDQIASLLFKAKENRQLCRSEVEALCAMAKERNALIATRIKEHSNTYGLA